MKTGSNRGAKFIDLNSRKEKDHYNKNNSEFSDCALDKWAYEQKVNLHFINPRKPVQKAYLESFNGKFRQECLNNH